MRVQKLIIAFLFLSCSNDVDTKYTSQQNNDNEIENEITVNILFIGNSLTIANNGIDYHVKKFYDNGNPDVSVNTHSVSVSGASLKEHLMSGIAAGEINNKDWDYIILQENGIVATVNPEETIASILSFKEIISPSTTTFLFMTWAYENQPEMTDQLSSVYYEASELTNYKVIPVGLAWRDFMATNETSLLNPDGLHPNMHGTYFASAMIFSILSNQNIIQVPYHSNLEEFQAQYIKQRVIEYVLFYY
tara:strand:+ start:9919 stop:10662 length:744 start_codon:yes stop_codon:yes gene_type:complete